MSKLNSRKLWIVIWSCMIVSAWGTYSLHTGKSPAWMAGAMTLLIGIPAVYVGAGSIKKKMDK